MTLKDLKKEPEKKFLENIKTLFGSRYDESAWKRISKYHKKDFIHWVRETKQQDWSKKHMGESRWLRAWQLYQQEYIAFVIGKRLKELKSNEPKHCPCCMIGTCKGVKS